MFIFLTFLFNFLSPLWSKHIFWSPIGLLSIRCLTISYVWEEIKNPKEGGKQTSGGVRCGKLKVLSIAGSIKSVFLSEWLKIGLRLWAIKETRLGMGPKLCKFYSLYCAQWTESLYSLMAALIFSLTLWANWLNTSATLACSISTPNWYILVVKETLVYFFHQSWQLQFIMNDQWVIMDKL